MPVRRCRYIYVLIALIAFTLNAAIALKWPRTGGDWDSYGTVAENIYRGNGVSLSTEPPYDPAFGGNHFPGYPAFIALVWFLFGQSEVAVRLAQSLVFACCVGVFSYAAGIVLRDRRMGLLCGFVTALSPLSMAWSRSLQVEALSIGSIMFFFACLFVSFSERRVKVYLLSVAVLVATYLRTDGVLLLCSLSGLLFLKGVSKVQVAKKAAVIVVIVFVGLGGWLLRNRLVGMENIFPPTFQILGDKGKVLPTPYGYVLWGWTWISTEYERGGWGFPVSRTGYNSIYIPPSAYDSDEEKKNVEMLLDQLKPFSGLPFPQYIDQEFMKIAVERIRKSPFRMFVTLPLKRMGVLWSHPGSSAGWPFQMDGLSYEERTRIERGLISGAISLLRVHTFEVAGKGIVLSVTILSYLLGFWGFLCLVRSGNRILWVSLISYFAARTFFFAYTNNVESRYMSQLIPLLQLLAVYGVIQICRSRVGVSGAERDRLPSATLP